MKKIRTACDTRLSTRRLTEGAMIAALYTAATLLLAPTSFGQIQLRAAEALTLLPALTPSAVIGLTVGCAISNGVGVAMGANICGVADIFFGSAATLLAAIASRILRKVTLRELPILSALPPVIFNGLIIGGEIAYMYGLPYALCAAEVAAGELIATMLLGLPLVAAVKKLGIFDSQY